jgi:predicted GIY-YIG superfamily endonuclease
MCDLLERPHSMAVSNGYREHSDPGYTDYFRTCPAPRIEAREECRTPRVRLKQEARIKRTRRERDIANR